MQTTVTLSDFVTREAKRVVAQRNIKLSALLKEALCIYLSRMSSGIAAAFHLHTVAGKLVKPALNLDHTTALDALKDVSDFARLRNR